MGAACWSGLSGTLGSRTEQSYQLVRGLLDGVVDDRHVELRLRRQLLVGVRQPAAIVAGSSVPRPISRRSSSSPLGGARKTSWASGMASPHLPGALQVDLQQAGDAGGERAPPARAACRTGCPRTPPTRAARPRRPAARTPAGRRSGSARRRPRSPAAPGGHRDRQPHPRRARRISSITLSLPTPEGRRGR